MKKNLALACLALSWQVSISQDFNLSRSQMKPFEGLFQNPSQKEQVVQFTADSGFLVAKLLWNGASLRLYPSSDSVFYSKEGEQVVIRFSRGEDGTVSRLHIGNNQAWNRVKEYHSFVRKEIPHTAEDIRVYEGLYRANQNPGLILRITEKDNSLVLKQLWDSREVSGFVPDSMMSFFNKSIPQFTIHFSKDSSGKFNKMVAFGHDHWTRTEAVRYKPEDLLVFEGKYKLQADPDDMIQVRAAGDHLVVRQLWDGKEIPVSPVAGLFFYGEADSFSIYFIKNNGGKITQATALDSELFDKMEK
jgi:hypothetical protein